MPPHDIPADMYLLLGRLEGKVDGIAGTLTAMSNRTDALEKRVGEVEGAAQSVASRLDALGAERAQQVPAFEHLLVRAESLETWRTEVQATAKTTSNIVRVVWGLIGTFVLALLGWLVTAYVHSISPAVERRATTKIESTVTTPAPGGGH